MIRGAPYRGRFSIAHALMYKRKNRRTPPVGTSDENSTLHLGSHQGIAFMSGSLQILTVAVVGRYHQQLAISINYSGRSKDWMAVSAFYVVAEVGWSKDRKVVKTVLRFVGVTLM